MTEENKYTLYFPLTTDQGEEVWLPKCELDRIALEKKLRKMRKLAIAYNKTRKMLTKNKLGSYSRN